MVRFILFFIALIIWLTLIVIVTGCGDGDRDTDTITISDTNGNVNINQTPDEEADPILDACFRCVGNPSDGITDEQCLAAQGVFLSECPQ